MKILDLLTVPTLNKLSNTELIARRKEIVNYVNEHLIDFLTELNAEKYFIEQTLRDRELEIEVSLEEAALDRQADSAFWEELNNLH